MKKIEPQNMQNQIFCFEDKYPNMDKHNTFSPGRAQVKLNEKEDSAICDAPKSGRSMNNWDNLLLCSRDFGTCSHLRIKDPIFKVETYTTKNRQKSHFLWKDQFQTKIALAV